MGRPINVYKWIVLAWTVHKAHKAFKLARAVVRAKRLKNKAASKALIARYDDL